MLVKEKAREIEEHALRKEQLINAKSGTYAKGRLSTSHYSTGVTSYCREDRNIDDTLEVNDMLVDAIKAKLAILDTIN